MNVTVVSQLSAKYGDAVAKEIIKRLVFLKASPSLADVPHTPPYRRHQLKCPKGVYEYSIQLPGGDRIVFRPDHDPVPLDENGGVTLKEITAIEIIGIGDYH